MDLLSLRTIQPAAYTIKTHILSHVQHLTHWRTCQCNVDILLLQHTFFCLFRSVNDKSAEIALRSWVTLSCNLKPAIKTSEGKVSQKSPENTPETKTCFPLWFTSTFDLQDTHVCVSVTELSIVVRVRSGKFTHTMSGSKFIHMTEQILCGVKLPRKNRSCINHNRKSDSALSIVSVTIFGSSLFPLLCSATHTHTHT